jgi:curli biogenesis system outer membrane secretion channel CsgG
MEDVTLTGERASLKEAGIDYRGPRYSIAILNFNNKTPSRTLGIGEAATDIMRTLIKEAGLEPVVMSPGEMSEQERLIELQQTGALKTGMRDAAAGFESVDFRLTGSVTSYSEIAESFDVLLGQSKTIVARVQVDYALVDIATGRSLVADSGTGVYKKKTTKFLGIGSGSTSDPALRDGALRDALTRSIKNMVNALNARPFVGRILFVGDGDILIRAGTKSRLDIGTTLSVYRMGDDLVDPDTGRSIGKRQKKIGELVITGHQDDQVSYTQAESGSGFSRGDVVKER